jgi:hypothetical protein
MNLPHPHRQGKRAIIHLSSTMPLLNFLQTHRTALGWGLLLSGIVVDKSLNDCSLRKNFRDVWHSVGCFMVGFGFTLIAETDLWVFNRLKAMLK